MDQKEILGLLEKLQAQRTAADFHAEEGRKHNKAYHDCQQQLATIDNQLLRAVGANKQIAMRSWGRWVMVQTFTRAVDNRVVFFQEVQLELIDGDQSMRAEDLPL